jgi:hypothetical protein
VSAARPATTHVAATPPRLASAPQELPGEGPRSSADWRSRVRARPTFKPALVDRVPVELAEDFRTKGGEELADGGGGVGDRLRLCGRTKGATNVCGGRPQNAASAEVKPDEPYSWYGHSASTT